MKKMLRIYMPHSAKVKKGLTGWQRFWNASLSNFALRQAKSIEIDQAIYLPVNAGYLKGRKISFNISEIPPKDFPTVLEIIDDEEKIKDYLRLMDDNLEECQVYIFNPEEHGTNIQNKEV